MLARVERRLRDESFVVIGVHSPKFPNEKDERMVREAVRRHGVTHPVVVDSGHRVWQQYAIRAWPTLVVIGPDGRVLGAASGEPDEQPLEDVVRTVLAKSREAGIALSTAPLPLRPEPAPAGTFAYPGKVAAGAHRLYVADTGHNQVVELEVLPRSSGVRERRRFGDGVPALIDGAGASARFAHPQGLALDHAGHTLWVADTGNHAVRRIDLASAEVTTAAGTGGRGRSLEDAALRSPWDVALDATTGRVYVAMAGAHQIAVLDPRRELLEVLAGTGEEARRDGPAPEAAFAQPSGLALLGEKLYVADAEISCVRELDLQSGMVRTVAGGDLFEFGDRDGTGDEARLQHPIGIAADPASGTVLLADSFNHKVKRVDPRSNEVRTLYGDGRPLDAAEAERERRPVLPAVAGAGAPLLFEPEGLAVADGVLWIADTNNHRLVAIDLATGQTASSALLSPP